MDLDRMLRKCKSEQWKVGDLDWTGKPRSMSEDDEVAIVQYFTDMSGIERLAGALFEVQRKNAEEPKLQEIFKTFVVDEVRHSHAAQMLADFYDARKLKAYTMSPSLATFFPHFVDAVQYLTPSIANAYITGGELILDIALLRSINDYVHDDMSEAAMELINRDESRHIAMDFYMTELYASREWLEKEQEMVRKRSLARRARAYRSFVGVVYHARPFFQDVFFLPMTRVDPAGRRLREAFKRMQLLGHKDEVAKLKFTKFMTTAQSLFNTPIVGKALEPILLRILGVDASLAVDLFTKEELARSRKMSFDEMAQDALAAKTLH
jgi:hypothetical protein